MVAKKTSSDNLFLARLQEALKHYNDPQWLGENSPLAAPYFLGDHLFADAKPGETKVDGTTAVGRGEILRRLLAKAASALPEIAGRQLHYYQRLVQYSYFRPVASVNHRTLEFFDVGRAQYYRDLKEAVEQLARLLVQELQPSLRLEVPSVPDTLVARRQELRSCLEVLRSRKRLAIYGPGGIGKSSLAGLVAAQLAPQPVFWYTFHHGLTDRLRGLIFSLAFFLQSHGANRLWLQLVADEGKSDMAVVQALLYRDLETMEPQTPLLCFDDIDLLRHVESEAHRQVVNFLESLPHNLPLLLIGQAVPVDVDTTVTLTGLPLPAMRELLAKANIHLSDDPLARLEEYTHGNPRLLNLFIALNETGEDLAGVLAQMAMAPSMEALLNRVWQRLEERERDLLASLAVYRRPAPDDAWPELPDRMALDHLFARRLVQIDAHRGVTIVPAFRQTVYASLTPESRENLHLEAAKVRATRGEITSAVYHLIQGREPQLAVRLWYPQRRMEINQGQADAALNLFNEISRHQLEGEDQELLAATKVELHKLLGDFGKALEELRNTQWRTPLMKAKALRDEGDIAELTGQMEVALRAYQEGLETVGPLVEAALFHRDLGWIYRRESKFDKAIQEVRLARFDIEYMEAEIEFDRGNLAAAQAHYWAALALAEETKYVMGEGKVRNRLAFALAQQGEFELAEAHWARAYGCYQRVGKQTSLASVRVNQATGFILAGEPGKAIVHAEEALQLFDQFGQPFGQAVAHTALAEAYAANGELDHALVHVALAYQTEEMRTAPDVLRIEGEIRLVQGDTHTAERLMLQAIDEAENNEDRYLEAYARRALGKVYLEQERAADAENALCRAIELFEELALAWEVGATRKLLPENGAERETVL